MEGLKRKYVNRKVCRLIKKIKMRTKGFSKNIYLPKWIVSLGRLHSLKAMCDTFN